MSDFRMLYFAPFEAVGHHALYAKHFLHAVKEREVVATVAASCGLIAELKDGSNNAFNFHYLDEKVMRKCGQSQLTLRGVMQLREGEKAARAVTATHIFQSWIDQALLAIAFGQAHIPVSGIWFRVPTLPVSAWPMGRKLLYRAAFARRALRHVFVLDEEVARALNAEPWTRKKVHYLPEPVDLRPGMLPNEVSHEIEQARAEDRRIYGIVGVLDERKGIEEVLRALLFTPGQISQRILLFMAGSFIDDLFKIRCLQKVQELSSHQSELKIIMLDRRLSDEEFRGAIDCCDTVLLTYRGDYRGSSGILVQAVARRKAIIGCCHDIVGNLIRRHALGRAIDTSDVDAIRAAICEETISSTTVGEKRRERFISALKGDRFGETILCAAQECGDYAYRADDASHNGRPEQ